MNIQTIKFVSLVAGMAASRINNGESLKKICAYVSECLDEEVSPVEDVDGVDFVQARLTLSILCNETLKRRFIYNAEGLVKNMYQLRLAFVGM
ncbi:hypothetical protein P9477_17765 [Enterobacter mori]|uniref:hypothetical protein n=1 Tax=Enterobacter mori TaxID=539813 RepID=UPI00398AE6AB